jgi:DNA processing protein
MATEVFDLLRERGVERFGLRIHQAGEYPQKLRDARDPVELLVDSSFGQTSSIK